ncbi:ParB N-terminal domain-containing protein [Streptomyces griseus]|uniref:hypothetical protein n=1 Tax=Streptomyces griseus TaxID=1911 RepID=UPI0036CBA245
MTKARLGEDSNDPERRLTKKLAPVREVMESSDLDFNQLLQRDLDDHRVAMKLIPYLMKEQATGPAFLPPIVAVLLPFKGKRPTRFPEIDAEPMLVADDGASWLQTRAGDSFQVQHLAIDGWNPHPASIGKLWWNSAEAELVVLDGQHRAMALLAVERTMNKSWQGAGAKYRSFYEHQVEQLLAEHDAVLDLNKVEVPVTVCWFPKETGSNGKPHEAARKLFVDVNKEARPPSESRIILLSDGELKNVLTRRLLSELRGGSGSDMLPIYAVEYDNPQVNASAPARWSVLTTINVLKSIVDKTVFGPSKYLRNLSLPYGGNTGTKGLDEFMRQQLDVDSLFSESFEDGDFTYRRDELGNLNFPAGQLDIIGSRFADTWGRAMLTLLSHTAPYAAHAKALNELKMSWYDDETTLTLARDAIFNGMGVFWTLRDSHAAFVAKQAEGLKPIKSDVISAWLSLKGREESFEHLRSKAYLESVGGDRAKKAKDAYAVFNTQACQVGQAITLASLWEIRKSQGNSDLKELPMFAESLVEAWNAFFAQDHGKGRDRKFAFNSSRGKHKISDPLNQIANMDTHMAVYFRYFWLQALATPVAREFLTPWFTSFDKFENALSGGRSLYLELLVSQQVKALRTMQPELVDSQIYSEARGLAHKSLRSALKSWYYVDDDQYLTWMATTEAAPDAV